MDEKKALEAIKDIGIWMEENQHWLTEWLTNVIMLDRAEAEQFPGTFGAMVVPIASPPPEGLFAAGNVMKASILKQAIFGKERKRVLIQGRTPTYTAFGGFIEAMDRKPEEGDRALFTAVEWFHAVHLTHLGLSLRTVCTVEYIAKE